MRHRLYAHLIWTTRDRAPLIDARVARFLDRFLRVVARQERAIVLELGLVRSHLHLLIRYHPLTNLPRLLQRLKGASANVASREHHASVPLRWARGYTIESVSRRALSDARGYVRDQAKRHPGDRIEGWTPGESVSAEVEAEWISEDRRFLGRRPRRDE